MLDFQQKRKLRSFLYNKVTIAILVVFVLISMKAVWTAHSKLRESEELRKNAEERMAVLTKREVELRDQMNRLQTDQGVEAEIRSKYSVAKENENVVVIVEDAPTTTEKVQKRGFFGRIFDFFTK